MSTRNLDSAHDRLRPPRSVAACNVRMPDLGCLDGRSRSSSWSEPISQYVGAAIGVFLFETTEPATVAWLRAAAAAVALVAWRRPWRRGLSRRQAGNRVDLRPRDDRHEHRHLRGYSPGSRSGPRSPSSSSVPPLVAALGSRQTTGSCRPSVSHLSGCFCWPEWSSTPTWTGVLFALVSAAMWAGYILVGKRVADTGDGLDSLAVGMSLGRAWFSRPPSSFRRPASTLPCSPIRGHGCSVCVLALLSTAIPYALGSTRPRPDRQGEVRPAAGAAARDRDPDRSRRVAPDTDASGDHRHRAGHQSRSMLSARGSPESRAELAVSAHLTGI